MKLAKVENWIEEAQSVDVPLLVSSVEWEHTKLVDHVNIPLGANFVIGCEESDIIRSVWEGDIRSDEESVIVKVESFLG